MQETEIMLSLSCFGGGFWSVF